MASFFLFDGHVNSSKDGKYDLTAVIANFLFGGAWNDGQRPQEKILSQEFFGVQKISSTSSYLSLPIHC